MDYSNLPLVAFNAPPQLSIDLKLFKDQLGQEYKVELWLGSCFSCYICLTKLNFSLIIIKNRRPALTYYFEHVICHVIIIIYLATFWMIFLDFVFRRYKWSKVKFCWKNYLSPYKIFCEKRDGHSKRERMEIIDLHLKTSKMRFCWIILLKTATNSSNNGCFHWTSHDMSRDLSEVSILL